MQVGLFGQIGDLLGREVEIDASGAATISDLRRLLAIRFPAAADIFTGSTLKAAVHDRMVEDSHSLGGIERVESLPPFPGG